MKRILLAAACLCLIASCRGGETASLRTDCMTFANDADGKDNIAGMGITGDQFCDCLMAMYAQGNPGDQAAVSTTMAEVAKLSRDTGMSIEDVAGKHIAKAMLAPGSEEAERITNGIRTVADLFDDIERGYASDQKCPAS